jgi:hypothetical protein
MNQKTTVVETVEQMWVVCHVVEPETLHEYSSPFNQNEKKISETINNNIPHRSQPSSTMLLLL